MLPLGSLSDGSEFWKHSIHCVSCATSMSWIFSLQVWSGSMRIFYFFRWVKGDIVSLANLLGTFQVCDVPL